MLARLRTSFGMLHVVSPLQLSDKQQQEVFQNAAHSQSLAVEQSTTAGRPSACRRETLSMLHTVNPLQLSDQQQQGDSQHAACGLAISNSRKSFSMPHTVSLSPLGDKQQQEVLPHAAQSVPCSLAISNSRKSFSMPHTISLSPLGDKQQQDVLGGRCFQSNLTAWWSGKTTPSGGTQKRRPRLLTSHPSVDPRSRCGSSAFLISAFSFGGSDELHGDSEKAWRLS